MSLSMERENRELLVKGASHFGIRLEEKMVEAFDLYLRELLKWNEKINLTALRTEKGIVLKHFLDSLSVFPHLSKISSLLDIGSGAGFPGIPLKMVCPYLDVTLIDSVRKKVDFQKHIIRTLGLKGITASHGRAQDTQVLEALRGRFDGVIARAFSNLDTLLLLGSPFLKKGGTLLAMKGEEMESFSRTGKLPYQFQRMVQFSLPFSSIKRSVLLFEKL
ncbi:MAG: 16S rRNA (guanine(527)-N(7))-methyltransferase RsmG [Deltaproteobacteria bacterium]|nr:16S rRNA (guanine(527)-N(7))-methyltransferase RsmG [Deltaproteobacteria bacterium]MBM4324168.1 16S rRNA (guanine(527)-N(7))-methyltransferase RsmG [Deltaproteobacteria bacterium]MBM4347703.1 16S rRNA (guanine(527)-N(7))-methyltransferase RsmG [Deltaproteobacteria bacterium]